MSELLNYAKKEMRIAGLYDQDADYGPGAIAECVEKMIEAFSGYGHSGGSAEMALSIFDRVVRFRPLSNLTRDPVEWMEVSPDMWQSRRQPDAFSTDGGRTYYTLDDRETIRVSAEP